MRLSWLTFLIRISETVPWRYKEWILVGISSQFESNLSGLEARLIKRWYLIDTFRTSVVILYVVVMATSRLFELWGMVYNISYWVYDCISVNITSKETTRFVWVIRRTHTSMLISGCVSIEQTLLRFRQFSDLTLVTNMTFCLYDRGGPYYDVVLCIRPGE